MDHVVCLKIEEHSIAQVLQRLSERPTTVAKETYYSVKRDLLLQRLSERYCYTLPRPPSIVRFL
jgi:hypothetical protein